MLLFLGGGEKLIEGSLTDPAVLDMDVDSGEVIAEAALSGVVIVGIVEDHLELDLEQVG